MGQGWGYLTDRDKSEWVGSSLNGLDRLEWHKLVKRYGAHQYALGSTSHHREGSPDWNSFALLISSFNQPQNTKNGHSGESRLLTM